MSKLNHKTTYEDASRISAKIPLVDSLRQYHEGGTFPLVEDPRETGKTSFVGMFVLRPAREAWTSQDMGDVRGWAYNVRGADGGWLIAGGNVVDANFISLKGILDSWLKSDIEKTVPLT